MKTVLTLLLTTCALLFADLPSISYHTADGAFVEELACPSDPRLDVQAFIPTIKDKPQFESDLVATMRGDTFVFALDVGAFFRNERRRAHSFGYIAELNGNAVAGEPPAEGPGFIARQVDNVKTAWQENPWQVVALGTGAFLLLDYVVFDSGELNAWGLLGSTSNAPPVEEGNSAGARAQGNASVIVVEGNNNSVTVNNNDSDSTSPPTVVGPFN